ncbi:MAG: TonB-dependent receptor, partial [Bacteroidota bacterium]
DATDLRDNQVTAELNLLRQYRIGPHLSGFVKAGTKLRLLDRTFDAERNGQQGIQFPGFWNSVAETCLAEALGPEWDDALAIAREIARLPISVFETDYDREGDFINGDYGLGIVPDVEMLTQFTRALQSEGCASEYLRNSIGSIGQDYEGTERYRAAYLMARIDIGRYVTLIPGIRYEGERTEYTGQRFREIINALREGPPADLEELVIEREHDYWLPMIHLDIRPLDWLSVRLARTETISRPSFNQYAPITSIDGFGNFIRAANADLRPSEATNYDASVQVINDKLGLFGVSAFRKQIDGLIFPVQFPARRVVADGDTTLLGVPAGTNVPSGWLEGTTPELSTFVNNEAETTYWGVEFEWQTNFSYLPGALKGLVLNLNYTRSFSEATYRTFLLEQTFIPGSRPPRFELSISDTTRTGRMPDQSANVFNATLGYDIGGFSARLSYLYQSNTASFINPREALLDTFVGDYSRFDLSLRQKVLSGFEVFANLNNLNNREDRSFTGQVDGDSSFSETYPS